MIFDYTYEGDRLDADIQYTSLVSEKTRVVIGGGLREDSMYSPAFLDTNSTLHNKTVMAQGQMEHRFTPGVILNLGAMWEDSDQISPVWSPRAALILHPSEPHTVRIAYNSGSRQGMTREEKVRQSVINEAGTFKLYKEYASGGLEPEKVETVEIGYRFDSQRFTVDSRIYRDKATDLITAFLTAAPVGLLGYYTNFTEVMDYRNEDAVTIKGFELDAEWRPTSQDRLRLIYAHTDIKQDAPSYLDYSASAPENQYGLLYTRQMPNGWSVSAFYTWVDKMAWLAQPEIDEYDRLDVRLAKRTRLSASNVTVELVGQGINSRHADFDPANEWSPVYFVRAKLEL
jgi:outer membrane receptor for ferrienterochelin and colicin